jgi:hypothetical protein
MATATRLAGTVALLAFLAAFALRPLLSNPVLSAAFGDGGLSPATLAAVPPLLVAVLLVAARVRTLAASSASESPDCCSRHTNVVDRPQSGTGGADRYSAPGSSPDDRHTDRPPGEGKTRPEDAGIEAEPPDAALRAHLDHLRTELDGEAARDLETMAAVVEEVETETVPERCPQPHCDAAWTARTLFGVTNGKYERLDGGERVRCLECERTVALV